MSSHNPFIVLKEEMDRHVVGHEEVKVSLLLGRITRPVNVQTTMVSIKVWVMDTRPWPTGFLVLAAAAAIGELPSPDSLENIPRATPILTVCANVAPRKPPAAATGEKAY